MTAQQLLVASLDYKRILERTGVKLTEQTVRVLNGHTEYLCAQAQIAEGECGRPECQAGAPYTSDLVDDAKFQTKLDCERDAILD